MASQDPWSPWATFDGWRLDAVGGARSAVHAEWAPLLVQIQPDGASGFRLDIRLSTGAARASEERGERLRLCVDGATREVGVVSRANEFVVTLRGRECTICAL